MPPSDRAMRRRGYFFQKLANSQSAAALAIEIGIAVIQASIGDSSDGYGTLPAEPMWQHKTTALASQTAHSGSHAAACRLGRPISDGFSGNEIAWTSNFAKRSTSATASVTSHRGSRPSLMRRSG